VVCLFVQCICNFFVDFIFHNLIESSLVGDMTVTELISAGAVSLAKKITRLTRTIRRNASSVLPRTLADDPDRVYPDPESDSSEVVIHKDPAIFYEWSKDVDVPSAVSAKYAMAEEALGRMGGQRLASPIEEEPHTPSAPVMELPRNAFGDIVNDSSKVVNYDDLMEAITTCRELMDPSELSVFDNEWRYNVAEEQEEHVEGSEAVESADKKPAFSDKMLWRCWRYSSSFEKILRMEIDSSNAVAARTVAEMRFSEQKDVVLGLDVLSAFISDLMGGNCLRSRVFMKYFREEYQQKFVVTKLLRYIAIFFVLAINGIAVTVVVLTGMRRGSKYHRSFVIAAVLQIIFECFVVETVEWIWVYGITPRQIERTIRNAVAVLRNCVTNAFAGMEHEAINVPEYFFVSTKIARAFPQLVDSAIVLSYETQYLRHLSPTWRSLIDDWVDRNWDVDIDYAFRLLYIVFQKFTLLRCGHYASLYIGTLPIIMQRPVIRVLGFLICGAVYVAVRFRHHKALWYIIAVSVWVGHELMAWYCRKREASKVSVMAPKDRERNDIKHILFSPVAATPTKKNTPSGKSPAKSPNKSSGKSSVKVTPLVSTTKQKPIKYNVATPSTVGNYMESNYTNPVGMFGTVDMRIQEEKKEEVSGKTPQGHLSSPRLLIANETSVDKYSSLQKPMFTENPSFPASIRSMPALVGDADDVVHVSLDDNDDHLRIENDAGADGDREGEKERDEEHEEEEDTIDDDDDDYSRFYPSLRSRVEVEYSDVLNAIDGVLLHSDTEDE
jgi:hypothetical protein